jgi:hypothetical protein
MYVTLFRYLSGCVPTPGMVLLRCQGMGIPWEGATDDDLHDPGRNRPVDRTDRHHLIHLPEGAIMKCQTCQQSWPTRVQAYEGPEGYTYLCDSCSCAEFEIGEPSVQVVYSTGATTPESQYVATYRPY